MKRGALLNLIFVLTFNLVSAQTLDSLVLSPDRFLGLVKQYHPVARQGDMILQNADANVLKSRGGFDPKLSLGHGQKYFDNTNYFNFMSGNISIPTYWGIEFKGGYDYNRGAYLNPENKLPDAGLSYAGIAITLGKGLIIDERRLALRQAQIGQTSSKFERQLIYNELLYDAGKAYWDWFAAYHNYEVYQEAYVAAFERLSSVKISATLGDRPFIDTLEAFIQLNERQFSLLQSEMELKNKSIELSNYLWDENGQPLSLAPNAKAPDLTDVTLDAALFTPDTSAWRNHPALELVDLKIQSLAIERKWKIEQLKPVINLNYKPYLVNNSFNSYSLNDYKFGLNFSMPILLRKERGDLKMTGVKIRQTELDRSLKTWQVYNKNLGAVNEYIYTLDLINQYRGTVMAYADLLDAERNIFRIGESSLFMINSRELSYIGAKVKLIDVIVKNMKAELTVRYSTGELGKM